VYETSSADNSREFQSSPPLRKRFYGKPGFELLTDDYMKLPLMEEVFFELVPRVRLRKWDSVCDISILDPAGNRLYMELPSLMIDGVMIRDPNLIGNLDPALVEKIDVIWDIYMVDEYSFHGIVNLITRTADFSAVPLPPQALRMNYRITDPAVEFIHPDHSPSEAGSKRIPDFRNTLYWSPSLKTGSNNSLTINFYTSDQASDNIISIQGISGKGEPFSLHRILKVE
jgi:hypothetical protein